MRVLRISVCLFACLLMLQAFGAERRPRKLMVGDKAPRLWASAWAGEPVQTFQGDKVHVVSFWNKSVVPSVQTLNMLNRVQKRFEDKVKVVAFNLYSQELQEILTKKRQYPNLTFAQDQLSEFSSFPTDGETGRAWMSAAGFSQTPVAFIVNEQGRVAWLGRTMFIESTLNQFMRRRPNLEAERKQYAIQIGLGQNWQQLVPKIEAEIAKKQFNKALAIVDHAIREGHGSLAFYKKIEIYARQQKHKDVLAVYDEMLARPDTKDSGAINKLLYVNRNMRDPKAAGKLLREYTKGPFKNDWSTLNGAAWALVAPRTAPRDVDIEAAYVAAARSVELDRNAYNVDTLARVLYLRGDPKRAADLQREAITLGPPRLKNEFEMRLAEYVQRGKERMEGLGRTGSQGSS
jgi:tetratricopeptide (TPR) repeat protein